MCIQFGRVDVYLYLLGNTLLVGLKEVEFVLVYIVYALKLYAYVDRPRQRTHANL